MRFRFFALAFLIGSIVPVGCSGNWGTVSGTVTLDGTPLREGTITFHPQGEGPTAYGKVRDGSFTIRTGQKEGLLPGKYKVTIAHMTIPESGSSEKAKFLTPERYSRPETSGLEADVNSGDNNLKFEMTTKPTS